MDSNPETISANEQEPATWKKVVATLIEMSIQGVSMILAFALETLWILMFAGITAAVVSLTASHVMHEVGLPVYRFSVWWMALTTLRILLDYVSRVKRD